MTDPKDSFHGTPKAMELFFIDNQQVWPEGTRQAGDLAVWEDHKGVYPSFMPITMANHPNFDGKIVVSAGTGSILIGFYPGAKSADDVRRMIKKHEPILQYRVAVEAFIQRMVLDIMGVTPQDNADPIALLTWMVRNHKDESTVVQAALQNLLMNSEALKATQEHLSEGSEPAFTIAEQMLESMQFTASRLEAAAAVPELKRRDR